MPSVCHIAKCGSYPWGKCGSSRNTLGIRRSSGWGIQTASDCPIQMASDCPILTSSECRILTSSDCRILTSSDCPLVVMHSYAHPPRKKVVPLHRKKDTTPNDIRSLTYCNTKFFLLERELPRINRELSWNIIFFNLRSIYDNLRSTPNILIFLWTAIIINVPAIIKK